MNNRPFFFACPSRVVYAKAMWDFSSGVEAVLFFFYKYPYPKIVGKKINNRTFFFFLHDSRRGYLEARP